MHSGRPADHTCTSRRPALRFTSRDGTARGSAGGLPPGRCGGGLELTGVVLLGSTGVGRQAECSRWWWNQWTRDRGAELEVVHGATLSVQADALERGQVDHGLSHRVVVAVRPPIRSRALRRPRRGPRPRTSRVGTDVAATPKAVASATGPIPGERRSPPEQPRRDDHEQTHHDEHHRDQPVTRGVDEVLDVSVPGDEARSK